MQTLFKLADGGRFCNIPFSGNNGSATFAAGNVAISSLGASNAGKLEIYRNDASVDNTAIGDVFVCGISLGEIRTAIQTDGSIYLGDSNIGSNLETDSKIKLKGSGSATFAGDVGLIAIEPDGRDNSSNELKLGFNNNLDLALKIRAVGAGSGGPGGSAGDLVFAHRGDNNSTFTDFTRFNYDGSATFAGTVLAGTTLPRTTFFGGLSAGIQTEASGIAPAHRFLSITNNTDSANGDGGGVLIIARSGGTTNGSHDVVADGNRLGQISFEGANGTNFREGARIDSIVEGTASATTMPSRLVFSTTAPGANTPTEHMRIRSNGKTYIHNYDLEALPPLS